MPLYRPAAVVAPNPEPGSYFYMTSQGSGTASGAGALTNNSMRVAPMVIDAAMVLDRLAVDITTAGETGSTLRPGIYADSGAGVPGSLVVDGGAVAADTTGVKEVTVSVTLAAGIYWVGAVVQAAVTTVPLVRIVNNWTPRVLIRAGTSLPGSASNVAGYTMAGVSGALPASFTIGAASATIPRIIARVA